MRLSDPWSCCAGSHLSLDDLINYLFSPKPVCVYFCHLQLRVLVKAGDGRGQLCETLILLLLRWKKRDTEVMDCLRPLS